jgi:lipid-binding SYLF domain-containing protein
MKKIFTTSLIVYFILTNLVTTRLVNASTENDDTPNQASLLLIKQSEEIPSKRVSRNIRDNAKCILVFPNVIKKKIVMNYKKSTGLVSCRLADKSWSSPLYVALTIDKLALNKNHGNAGIIIYLLADSAVQELLDPKVILGTNFDFIAGPVGSSAMAKDQPAIISYVRTDGLFAGLSIRNSRISFMPEANAELYGSNYSSTQTLTEVHKTDIHFNNFMTTLIGYAPLPLNEDCKE